MKKDVGLYLLGGITLVSELDLPELPRIQPKQATPHPAHIRVGEVAPPDGVDAVQMDPDCFGSRSRYYLRIQGVGRYLVSEGQEIVVSPEPGVLALDVRGYLLGALFVVLCQQRGLLPLHASALSSERGVVAFPGRSGQGKSSLAAHLAQRGFPVLADDVCLIDPLQADGTMVIPTAPWLKLWRNSLETLGRSADKLDRVFSDDDKYRLPLAPAVQAEPLRFLIFLEVREQPSTAVTIEDISPAAAIPLLMNLTHHAYLLEATGQREESFLRCSRVSAHVRAYRLLRPWGLTHLPATLDALEEFLRSK